MCIIIADVVQEALRGQLFDTVVCTLQPICMYFVGNLCSCFIEICMYMFNLGVDIEKLLCFALQ